jgi:hypothetical protein
MSERSVWAVWLTAAAIALSGCSGGVPGLGKSGTPAPAAAPSAPAGSGSAGGASAEAGVSEEALANPLATVEAPVPIEGDPKATLKVDLLGLERQGKLLVMTAAVTPNNTLAKEQSLFGMLGDQSFRPQLIDPDNLKLYEVVTAGGPLQSTTVGNKVPPGTPLVVHAVFAAPPPAVTRINVQVAEQVPTFTNVPIT